MDFWLNNRFSVRKRITSFAWWSTLKIVLFSHQWLVSSHPISVLDARKGYLGRLTNFFCTFFFVRHFKLKIIACKLTFLASYLGYTDLIDVTRYKMFFSFPSAKHSITLKKRKSRLWTLVSQHLSKVCCENVNTQETQSKSQITN